MSGESALGDPCEPEDASPCAEGLACESVTGSDEHVCAARVEIRGSVIDAIDASPIEGAHVVAVDERGTPVTAVVRTDAEGRYAVPVPVPRDAQGQPAEPSRWTLWVSAADYLTFPGALRPALPIDARDAVPDEESSIEGVIDSAATVVALLPRPASEAQGVTITGMVEGEAAGTLVVAEGLARVATAVADVDGAFTLFDVPAGSASIRGYRQGLELAPVSLTVADTDIADVRLGPAGEDPRARGVVRGSIQIVNAPGSSASSVVLVPSAVFDEVFERGPVPVGLRAPAPPQDPSITSAFEIEGVPAGRYHVLAAFEDDGLVRDPDETIAGTQIQQVEVAPGEVVELAQSFKLTEALTLVAPGADGPEAVGSTPTLVWVDDASEDRYDVIVRDALGEEIWREDQLVAVSGGGEVELPWGGPPLVPGMYYQFRVTALRDTPQGTTPISRSEDLRGVFVVR